MAKKITWRLTLQATVEDTITRKTSNLGMSQLLSDDVMTRRRDLPPIDQIAHEAENLYILMRLKIFFCD